MRFGAAETEMATGPSNGAVSIGTHALFAKAYESIQSDVQNFVKERDNLMKKDIGKVANDMATLKEGMRSMQSYIEHMHRQNPYGKKKVEELEEKLKRKDDEVEQLKNEIKELEERQDEKIGLLENFRVEIEEEREKVAEKKKSSLKLGVNGADKNGKDGSTKQDSSGKKFEFQDKLEGKNVMVANDMAVVSEGGDLAFLDPLKRNDPNSLLNKGAEIPMEPGSSPSDELSGIDGKFVGNERVNVQKNVQQVFLSGPGGNIEVEDEDENIKYHQANQHELSQLLEKAREDADEEEEEEEEERVILNPDEELLQKDVILRLANLFKVEEKVEHFIRLCEYLSRLSTRQLRSLAPDLKHITRINLSNVQINYKLLSAFFRCFKTKKFQWLLLRSSRINAADMRLLSSSLGACKIGYLDFGGCSYEYMAFFEMASLLFRVDNLILRSLTSAQIVPENGLGINKPFSADEARHLMQSISRSPKMIGLDLSNCHFRDVNVAAALSGCLQKASYLMLWYCIFTPECIDAMFGNMQKIQKLDFTCAELRNPGVASISAYMSRVSVAVLSNVLLDDDGVQPLIEALEGLPEKGMDILDVSFNPISVENVSKILKTIGKVNVIIFSREQISDDIHKTELGEQTFFSEVEGGVIYGLTDRKPDGFTHWVACTKPPEQMQQIQIMELTKMSPQEQEARAVSEYRCSNCKSHIAFTKDEIVTPCTSLHSDKGLSGVLENAFFTTVSHAVSCIPSNGAPKKHSCGNLGCPVTKFRMRGCKCAKCRQTIGGYYAKKDNTLKFWCLYQESPNTKDIGTSRQNCKQM